MLIVERRYLSASGLTIVTLVPGPVSNEVDLLK